MSVQRSWAPSQRLLESIRDYQSKRGLGAKFAVIRHRFWSAVTGADIPINCKIGKNLKAPHPNGIVIHPEAKIGDNCLIFQQVTIGDCGGVPTLGNNVDVGAGAKIIGPISIGDGARIGANAVVTQSVPCGASAVGVPARIVEKDRIYASNDAEAHEIAASKFGEPTIRSWTVFRDEADDRVTVCRNFHAVEGPEIVEYLDELRVGEARGAEGYAVLNAAVK